MTTIDMTNLDGTLKNKLIEHDFYPDSTLMRVTSYLAMKGLDGA